MKKLRPLLVILLLSTCQITSQNFILEEKDKQLHFTAGLLLGGIGYQWSYSKYKNKRRAIITGLSVSLLAGATKEIYDSRRGGPFDSRDMLATGMGGMFINLTIPLFQKKKKKKLK
tara:strand:- start:330 stop:677 length:348 start_codon:yes stop_codon:yes gene_type:complete